ncbi:MAG: prepilin peptidase [Oscillospiraceae bacterium]|nr:prepilin peptidase [Oscillospiraceae bacterium]
MYLTVCLFGLVIGSFLNVCICRIPEKQSISFPPSHCTSCNHKLGISDLFPIFSYLFLGGKCRYCKAKISPQYPIVEFLNCAIYAALFYRFGLTISFFLFAPLSSVLIVLAGIDIKHMLLPDKLVLIAAVLGIIYLLIPQSIIEPSNTIELNGTTVIVSSGVMPAFGHGLGIVSNTYTDRILNALIGALAGGGIFWLIAVVTRGNMGGGDIKLMAALGILFGLKGTAMVFLLAFVIGSVVSLIIVRVKKGGRKTAVPFGPFIILAAFITIFFYSPIAQTYMKLAGLNY